MIRKIFTWYLMLKKRLFKKTGFIVILLTIAMFSFVFAFFAEKEGGGLLRVALATENPDDEIAAELMQKVSEDSQIFKFIICESPDEAKRMVEASDAETAWVFMNDMEERLREIAAGDDKPLVMIYEPEENTLLKLSREKVFGTLYPTMSYYIYEEYVTNELLPGENITKEELREEYELIPEKNDIVEFAYLDAGKGNSNELNYFTSPLRGLLLMMMLLAGLAATMYFLKDEEQGTYSWIAPKKRIFISWGNNFAALSIAGVFVTLAIALTGNYTSFWQETVCMLLFVLMATAFCSVLGALFGRVNVLCILLPTILVAIIVFCPIFFDVEVPLQQILPPYYYLFAIYDIKIAVWMVLYCMITYPLGYVLNMRKK